MKGEQRELCVTLGLDSKSYQVYTNVRDVYVQLEKKKGNAGTRKADVMAKCDSMQIRVRMTAIS